jgi:hypothetical protein
LHEAFRTGGKMKIVSNVVHGMARLFSCADPVAGEAPRGSLEEPRLGRNLSRLAAHHQSGVTPLPYAVTKLAELIAPPHRVIDGERPAGRPVNEHSLQDYVRAILGMQHDETKIDTDLAPYLDELSKNESTFMAQPVTRSSFTLLCILYMADQVPRPGEYGEFSREAFMNWLDQQLDSGTVREDQIAGRYFGAVLVRKRETECTNRCAVLYGRDGANSVDVRSMRPFVLRVNGDDVPLSGADLRGTNMRGAQLSGENLQGADMRGNDLQGINLQGANLRDAKLEGANLRDANLRDANLIFTSLQGADRQGADLRGAKLLRTNAARRQTMGGPA